MFNSRFIDQMKDDAKISLNSRSIRVFRINNNKGKPEAPWNLFQRASGYKKLFFKTKYFGWDHQVMQKLFIIDPQSPN